MTAADPESETSTIKPIDGHSIHRITSGQVVIDLQTAVKELVENSLDAGATNIEVRFKEYGLKSIEVIDNGGGISPEDYDHVALKHHTSKLTTFEDLSTVLTFGFRGEALSSLCALSESVTVVTARTEEAPMGTVLEMGKSGTVKARGKVARQRGTTTTITGLFKPLPVRHKEFQRNAKREFSKALNLLNAYALVPCAGVGNGDRKGVRLTVSNHLDTGHKTVQLRTEGTPSIRSSVLSLWGPKAVDHLVDLDVSFVVTTEQSVRKRRSGDDADDEIEVHVKGLVSKFAVGCGRVGTDRQFFFVNGRPCAPAKVQKAFNEVYRSFNANQSPFVVADFSIPTNACDINVSPDKRTIFLHSENNLVIALKSALEEAFAASRSTYDVGATHSQPLKERRKLDGARSQSQSFGRSGGESMGRIDVCTEDNTIENQEANGTDGAMNHDSQPQDGQNDESEVESGHAGRTGVCQQHLPSALRDHGTPCKVQRPLQIASRTPSSLLAPDDDVCVSSQSSPSTQRTLVTTSSNNSQDDSSTGSVASGPANISPVPPKTREKPRLVQMVLDTTGASWNKSSRDETEGIDDGDEAPPRKKRRSDVAASDLEMGKRGVINEREGRGRGKGRISSRDGKDIRLQLREKLSGFARNGSQVPIDLDEDEEVDNTVLESDNGDEREDVVETVHKQAKQKGVVAKKRTTMHREVEPDEVVPGIVDDNLEGAMNIDSNSNEDVHLLSKTRSLPSKLVDLSEDAIGYDTSKDISMLDGVSEPSQSSAEIIRSMEGGDVCLRFDLSRISTTWRQINNHITNLSASTPSTGSPATKPEAKIPLDAGVTNTDDNDTAADALARVIEKEDFKSMDIIGQFNLGFIVTRRRKLVDPEGDAGLAVMMDDLFIVDQHAADEKYNFEMLQQTTNIESQRLLRPRPLELTAADELLAMENIEILRQNGFEIDVDGDLDLASGQGHRLKLVAQPISKSTVFDMKDLEELIHLMQDQPSGRVVRCSKARAMFAMRACRKSVMVGMPLTKSQMISVVQHMGTMDQPWNCPHGRPTMRHLSEIGNIADEKTKMIDWTSFGLV